VVPVSAPEKFTAGTAALLQTTIFAGSTTVGVGMTLMLNDVGLPKHSCKRWVYFGVTLKIPVCTVFVVFTVLNAAIFPEPLHKTPIEEFVFVQMN
jgi:hypothetical protein